MSANDHIRKSLAQLFANTDVDLIEPEHVACVLTGHDALDNYDAPFPPRGAIDITRADGEIMRGILHYETETDYPTGWTTAQGPSVDELQSEDGGASDDPEQVIRDLLTAILAWLDQCDMSNDQIEGLAMDLAAEVDSLSQERDGSGQVYLLAAHENGHFTSIEWDRKKRAFVCEEMSPHGVGDEYATDDVDTIITKLHAQARR